MTFRGCFFAVSLLLVLSLSEQAIAKSRGISPSDPEYSDYTEVLAIVFSHWGGEESCLLEPIQIKNRDGSVGKTIEIGVCTLPASREVCFEDHGKFCFNGAEARIIGGSSNVSFKKTAASLMWTLWIYDRCEDTPEHLLTFKYKFKRIDGVWKLNSKRASTILDMRKSCEKVLKQQVTGG